MKSYVVIVMAAMLSSCGVIKPDCPINKQDLFKEALRRAGGNANASFFSSNTGSFEPRQDCCTLIKFSEGADLKQKRDNSSAYYVHIAYKYTAKQYSSYLKQPYRVEFDQCGKVTWHGFPYGG